MLKVCLVGVGSISASHISAWQTMPDVQLSALCSRRAESMEKYPAQRHYTDFDEMLEKEQPDVLDVCLPTFLHTEYSLRAMERGIHVICEKPVSLDPADVDRLYDAAQRNRVFFMTAQVLRFWPEYQVLRQLCQTRRYGAPVSGFMSRLNGSPENGWMNDAQLSGLVPYDLHIHDLDFLVSVFGAPENVRSHRAGIPGQDTLNAVYEYPGFYVETEAAWYPGEFPFTARYRFQFERAVICMEGKSCRIYESGGAVLDLQRDDPALLSSAGIPRSSAYYNELRYFADCVLRGTAPDAVPPEELKTVLNILNRL